MPELPEVQTTIQGLQELINNQITDIKIYSTKLRYNIPQKIYKILINNKIVKIYRIGKYILFNLKNDYSLVIHLGMSGRLRLLNMPYLVKEKHNHFVLSIQNKILIFNDPRKFGFIDILRTSTIYNAKYIKILGMDALDTKLNTQYLKNKIERSIVPIKQILLNQRIIAGIGNIYASEILYDARISPFIQGNDLNIEEIRRIIRSTRKILNQAIKLGGSTLKNYTSSDGTLGNFQKFFKVYNQEGKKILGSEVKRIVQYGRSTYYCPKIQLLSNKKNIQNY